MPHRLEAVASPEFTFMGLRHSGNVEGAEADLTDAQVCALSGHQTTATCFDMRKRHQSRAKRQRGNGSKQERKGKIVELAWRHRVKATRRYPLKSLV